MTVSSLALPIDIPWRRLCVSEDMLDPQVCDRRFPYRWRSSLAVFSYQPGDDYQTYEGQTVSYLKVVATITGYQPDPTEVGLINRKVYTSWSDPRVIEDYLNVVAAYYGCYGAILEVAIAPHGRRVPLEDYPYFADFEPKKRELYETVTDTGEVMSRSLEDINVRKGATTTDSHEVLDVFGGASAQASYAGTGGGFGFQGQWGTIDMTGTEYANVRTSDQAREQRETYSHTTQLSQMYHQLDSYHLGTNRAVFFILPRPHIVQSDATFVNGPRLLEGIQELFLVVLRPKDTDEPCVEAYLETAHIASTPTYTHETSTGQLTLHVTKQAEDRDCGTCFGNDSNTTYADGTEVYTPPAGWEIDLDREGGYHVDQQSGSRIEQVVITAESDHVTAYGQVSAWFEDGWPDNFFHNGELNLSVTVFIRKTDAKITGYQKNLWITGRGICCCEDDRPWLRPSVVGEAIFTGTHKAIGREQMTTAEANAARVAIGKQMLELSQGPDAYERGTIGFAEASFVGQAVAEIVRDAEHPDNTRAVDVAGIPDRVKSRIEKVAPEISRGKLLEMSPAEQRDRFGLETEQVAVLRRAALGLEAPDVPPERRWDRPGQVIGEPVEVPNVVGFDIEEARAALRQVELFADDPQWKDDTAPRGTVTSQKPEAGARAKAGDDIDVSLSTGAEVLIPDVIGMKVSGALVALRDAGLESEPTLRQGRARKGFDTGAVLEVSPKARSYVTPNARVTLTIVGQSTSGRRSKQSRS